MAREGRGGAEPWLSAGVVVGLLDALEDGAGLRLSRERMGSLRRVVRERVERLRLSGAAAYLGLLRDPARGEAELQTLIDGVTIGETYFFRTRDFSKVFASALLPEMLARKARRPAGARGAKPSIAIWSGAASTGEELYSLAIWLLEAGVDRASWKIDLLGTDVNTEHLRRARRGRYTSWSFRGTAPDDPRLRAHFRQEGAHFVITGPARDMVRFAPGNLAHPVAPRPAQGRWDAIFLRNVLMYLSRPVARQAVLAACEALDDDGYLFVGECETLAYLDVPLQLVQRGRVFYYRKGAAPRRVRLSGRRPPPPRLARVRAVATKTGGAPTGPVPPATPAVPAPDPRLRAERLVAVAEQAAAQERTAEATSALERALELQPGDAAIMLRLADQHLIAARYEAAAVLCGRVVEADPIAARAHLMRGIARHGLGDLEGAWESFQSALFLDAGLAVAHYFAGKLAEAADDQDGAARSYSRALDAALAGTGTHLEAGLSRRALIAALRGWVTAQAARGRSS